MNQIGLKSDKNKKYYYQNIVYVGKIYNMPYSSKKTLKTKNIFIIVNFIEQLLIVHN